MEFVGITFKGRDAGDHELTSAHSTWQDVPFPTPSSAKVDFDHKHDFNETTVAGGFGKILCNLCGHTRFKLPAIVASKPDTVCCSHCYWPLVEYEVVLPLPHVVQGEEHFALPLLLLSKRPAGAFWILALRLVSLGARQMS